MIKMSAKKPIKKMQPAKRTVSKEFIRTAKEIARLPEIKGSSLSSRKALTDSIKNMLAQRGELTPEEKRLLRKLNH
ncbi:MAG: hypothetical protein N3D73_01205 [Candidatus Diapherotrites archaeon]|nr:hypothetical protein [Candidatus Diapherotrites archaeon]